MTLSATAVATLSAIANLSTERGAAVKTSTLVAPSYDIKQLYGTIPSLSKKGLVVKSEVEKVRYIALTEDGYTALDLALNPVAEVAAETVAEPVAETAPAEAELEVA